jgi:hypothetical protein
MLASALNFSYLLAEREPILDIFCLHFELKTAPAGAGADGGHPDCCLQVGLSSASHDRALWPLHAVR